MAVIKRYEIEINSNTELMLFFASHNKELFAEYFTEAFPTSRYVSYRFAEELIQGSTIKTKLKERMLRFLNILIKCKNINNAVEYMENMEHLSNAQMDKMFQKFKLLNLNPVTIPQEFLLKSHMTFLSLGLWNYLDLSKFIANLFDINVTTSNTAFATN